mgnify:CR=1 FL=1
MYMYMYMYALCAYARRKVIYMSRLGEDGFPVPARKGKGGKETFICICPICMSADASMKVAKTGNWNIRCYTCKTMIYLNDVTSINLFRGLQGFLSADPEHQVRHTAGLLAYAPDEGQ